jgi:hypothetical protein
MKSVRLFLVLIVAIVALAYLVISPAERGHREIADLTVGEPIVFRNLTIFPVTSKTPRHEDRFITLDEGLRAGTVEVLELGAVTNGAPNGPDPFALRGRSAEPQAPDPFAPTSTEIRPINEPPAPLTDPFANAEQGASAANNQTTIDASGRPALGNSVNQLMVVNYSTKPLYLMPGEVVVGGSQDRAVGQELVVAPDQKPVPLAVFCVEHGRWGGRVAETYAGILPTAGEGEPIAGFAANLSLDLAQTAGVANAGKFVGSIGNLNAQGRVAVQKDKNQAKVWDEVAKQNVKNTVESTSGTFTSNYSNPESADRLAPFIEQLLQPIDETKNIVGVIVAVNGEVKSMDVFEATPLFQKLWPKLLKSYALDAASDENAEEPPKMATRAEALSFLRETAKANQSNVETKGDLAVSQGESERVLLFSAHQRRQPEIGDPSGSAVVETKAMIGGLGGAIHSAGFAK